MKKILALSLVLALIFTLALTVSAATPISAPKATITVDGVKDDAYGAFVDVKGMRNDTPGATGKFATAWDDNCLYFYAEIVDTTPFHEHTNSYERDCIEIFIDWLNHKGDTNVNDDSPYWQVRIASAANEEGIQQTNSINGAEDAGIIEATKYVVKPLVGSDIKGGYIVEIAMPAKQFNITLTEGMVMGIDMQIGDNQTGDARTSQAFLEVDDNIDTQWNNPAACNGVLTLAAAPAAAAPATDAAPAPATDAAPTPVTSPKTSDVTVVMTLLAVASAFGGAVVFKKK